MPFAWLARFLPRSSRVESAAAYDAGSEVAGVHGAVIVVVVGHAEVVEAVLWCMFEAVFDVVVAAAVAIVVVVVIEPVRPAHDSIVRFSTLKVAR